MQCFELCSWGVAVVLGKLELLFLKRSFEFDSIHVLLRPRAGEQNFLWRGASQGLKIETKVHDEAGRDSESPLTLKVV